MNVICIEEEAFYALIEAVYQRLKTQKKPVDKWVPDKEAMKMLNIKSKSTLQKLRDTGSIRYSKVTGKNILYDTGSIFAYLEENAEECF